MSYNDESSIARMTNGQGIPMSVVTRISKTIVLEDTEVRKQRSFVVVEYYALNGQVFTTQGQWYEMQELINELSRQAYENDTALDYVVIS